MDSQSWQKRPERAGLATLGWTSGGLKGSVAKALREGRSRGTGRQDGSSGGRPGVPRGGEAGPGPIKTLGLLRLEFRDRLKLAPPDLLAFAWIGRFSHV